MFVKQTIDHAEKSIYHSTKFLHSKNKSEFQAGVEALRTEIEKKLEDRITLLENKLNILERRASHAQFKLRDFGRAMKEIIDEANQEF